MPAARRILWIVVFTLLFTWGAADAQIIRRPNQTIQRVQRTPATVRRATTPDPAGSATQPRPTPNQGSFSERQARGQENVDPRTIATDSTSGKEDKLHCGNLVYGGSKSSVCFSDKFLDSVRRETNCQPASKFSAIKLATPDIFNFPFSVMTGEGSFVLPEQERKNLRAYLSRGGFILASAGCSSRDWDVSFRKEIKKVFPEYKLKPLPLDHPIFHTVYDIKDLRLTHGGRGQLEGMEIDGKIVMIYSADGLNDTGNVQGCCCCGGNEVANCHEINVNAFTYALTH